MAKQQLIPTEEQRDLEITETNDLKWQKQTEKSCKTADRVLGSIARNFNYKSTELMLPLHKSLVGPNLEFAVQFWSPHLCRDIDKIERVQRKDTKMIPEIRNHSSQQTYLASIGGASQWWMYPDFKQSRAKSPPPLLLLRAIGPGAAHPGDCFGTPGNQAIYSP